jgi:hypothetical protein
MHLYLMHLYLMHLYLIRCDGAVQIGVVQMEIDYNWLRGTRDDGGRISTTQIRINNRKLPNPLAVISHVSNVNHWLLSHDNVWAALTKDHPALRQHKEEQKAAADAASSDSEHGSRPDLKMYSGTETDSVREPATQMCIGSSFTILPHDRGAWDLICCDDFNPMNSFQTSCNSNIETLHTTLHFESCVSAWEGSAVR